MQEEKCFITFLLWSLLISNHLREIHNQNNFHKTNCYLLLEAQKYLTELQGVNNSWFCGSYFGYGFHEDGLKSAMEVANKL